MSQKEKICVCGASLDMGCCEKNGVEIDVSFDDRVGVKVGRGDLYVCKACGQYTVSGFTIINR